ncbi:hypothetical protein [Bifidobacterium sp. SO1]|uniref:hypothetical protein n=1 Tax=Bifidobacterium sp. SO1 TaxID=2809029 RepID=UPI001BDCD3D3|nr:hypothetical protein [Bifidobacterium sp. SO1]MBT1161201.1 hypothetical protein [Bifidobacterium sp. SO1]
MTDETTIPETQTLDLRPAIDSVKGRLISLGLNFDYQPDQSEEIWRDTERMLLARVPADGETVTFEDTRTNTSKTVTVGDLVSIDGILTVTSDPIEGDAK